MCGAELHRLAGVYLVRESGNGVGCGVLHTSPAKHRNDLLTGNGHGNHPAYGSWLWPSCARAC
jgi:hypothetical protein